MSPVRWRSDRNRARAGARSLPDEARCSPACRACGWGSGVGKRVRAPRCLPKAPSAVGRARYASALAPCPTSRTTSKSAIAARPATVRGAPRCTVQLSCGVLPSGALFHIECRRMLRHSRAKRALPRHCSGRNGRNRMGCIACGRAGRKVNRTWGGDYEKLKVRHGAADFAAMQELHLLRCYRAGRPSAEPDPALVKVTGSMSLLFACCAPVSPALSAFLVSNRTCFGRKTA